MLRRITAAHKGEHESDAARPIKLSPDSGAQATIDDALRRAHVLFSPPGDPPAHSIGGFELGVSAKKDENNS